MRSSGLSAAVCRIGLWRRRRQDDRRVSRPSIRSSELNMSYPSFRQVILVSDLAMIAGAMGLGLGLRYAGTGQPAVFPFHWQPYILVVLVAMFAWTSLHVSMNLDGFKDGWHFPSVFSKLVV